MSKISPPVVDSEFDLSVVSVVSIFPVLEIVIVPGCRSGTDVEISSFAVKFPLISSFISPPSLVEIPVNSSLTPPIVKLLIELINIPCSPVNTSKLFTSIRKGASAKPTPPEF